MGDWGHGYVTGEGYSYGFIREMAPAWMDFALRLAGVTPARHPDGAFRYLDLGCGQGVGLCLLAAANPQADFVGVDFMPVHVAHGQRLAAAAGLGNLRFVEADFLDLAAHWPADFGTFDYVALHGVYSWIPQDVRAAVVACLGHATHPGSTVYNGYNTMPGWLGSVPFQHFAHAAGADARRSPRAALSDTVALFDRLRAAEAPVFQALPALAGRIEWVRERKSSAQAHEYLNGAWNPLWHSQVAAELAQVRLSHAATADLPESQFPRLLPDALRSIVEEVENPSLRQDMLDLIVNQTFRRDLFCRGAVPSFAPLDDCGRDTQLYLVDPAAAAEPLVAETAWGDLGVPGEVVAPLVELLRGGPQDLAALAAATGIDQQRMQYLAVLLVACRVVAPAAAAPQTAGRAQALNAVLAAAALDGAPYTHLACTALGSAVAASATDMMVIDGWLQAGSTDDASAVAGAIVQRLAAKGRGIDHGGRTLQGAAAAAAITPLVADFMADDLPRWRALGALT